jgi:hypothetical protein
MSETEKCGSCGSSKLKASCPLCETQVCSKCVVWMPDGAFSFLPERPAVLAHSHYCRDCFADQIEEPWMRYQEDEHKAREAFVFFQSQRAGIPILKREKNTLKVTNNPDRDETILRLAFQAVILGHNAIIDCEVKSQKDRHGGWQKMIWSGSAVAATVDEEKMSRR